MTAGTASRRMTCRKNDGPPGSVCRDRKSGRRPAFGNRLGQGLLTEHSIRSHTAPAGPPLWRTAGAVLFCGGQYRRLPGTALAAGRRPRKSYLRRGAMPGGPCRILKDISSSSRQCTHQAASPPLPVCGTRIMRRTLKRACILRPLHLLRLAVSAAATPQPLTGEPSQTAAARKASPARGGGCAARRRRRGAAPRPANILLGRRILSAAAALRRAGSCCTLKDTHAAKRQCPPQAALPPLPVCSPRIMRRTLKRACILRPLRYREAVKTGAVSD